MNIIPKFQKNNVVDKGKKRKRAESSPLWTQEEKMSEIHLLVYIEYALIKG